MCHQVGLVRVFERFSALDAEVALVDISDGVKPLNNVIKHRIITNDHVNVNARLRGHSLDRSTADVLGAKHQISQSRFDFRLDRLKGGSPRLVIGQNNNLFRFHQKSITTGAAPKEQIVAVEKETDATGAAITVDRTRNTNQYSEFNHDIMTGQSSVYLLDPWIYNELKSLNDGGKAYLCELSFVFGDELPQGALEDGYGIRLGDTALYKEYSIVRRLPADTVVCLMSPFGGLGQKVDDESYQYQIETFKALTTYVSDELEIPETESYFVDEKEEDAA